MPQKAENVQLEEINSGTEGTYAEVERFQMISDKDNAELMRLGKRPVLKAGA